MTTLPATGVAALAGFIALLLASCAGPGAMPAAESAPAGEAEPVAGSDLPGEDSDRSADQAGGSESTPGIADTHEETPGPAPLALCDTLIDLQTWSERQVQGPVEFADFLAQSSVHYRTLAGHLDGIDATRALQIAEASAEGALMLRAMMDEPAPDWDAFGASAPARVVEDAFEAHPVLGLPLSALETFDEECGLGLAREHEALAVESAMRLALATAAIDMEDYFTDHGEYRAEAVGMPRTEDGVVISVELRPDAWTYCLEAVAGDMESGQLVRYYDPTVGGITTEPC